MIEGKTILITGGAGFIGSRLADRLSGANKVRIYDNFSRDALSKTDVAGREGVEVIKGDVLDADAVREAMSGCQVVLHLAAIAGVDTVIEKPVETMRVNLFGTATMLEAALAVGGIERFVDFSTSEVFGTHVYHAEEISSTTVGAVGEARWTYAVSKLAAEHLTHNYGKQYEIPTASVRPFIVYGPGQVGLGAIHAFVEAALENRPIEVHGDGNQIRAWCYIDDMVDGVLLVAEEPAAVGKVFNIGNPRGTVTIATLAEKVLRLSGAKTEIVFTRKDYVDVQLRIPGIEQARTLLGYEPKVDLDEGLRRTLAWYMYSKK